MVMDSRTSAALDRYITGNYGADQDRDEEREESGPEPPELTVRVTISGQTYGLISGGGLLQTERPEIGQKLRRRARGFGEQYVADLTYDEASVLGDHIQGYGELFSGPGLDPDDDLSRREGKSCLRDAKRIREAIANW